MPWSLSCSFFGHGFQGLASALFINDIPLTTTLAAGEGAQVFSYKIAEGAPDAPHMPLLALCSCWIFSTCRGKGSRSSWSTSSHCIAGRKCSNRRASLLGFFNSLQVLRTLQSVNICMGRARRSNIHEYTETWFSLLIQYSAAHILVNHLIIRMLIKISLLNNMDNYCLILFSMLTQIHSNHLHSLI